MKRFVLCTLLVATLGVYSHVQAQFKESTAAWGLSAGGAHGDNAAADKWVMQYRGFFSYDIMPGFIGQLGLGFADLNAPGTYSALTLITDLRLLVSPFSLGNLNPYLYAGIGASKDLHLNGSSYLAIVPFGIGMLWLLGSLDRPFYCLFLLALGLACGHVWAVVMWKFFEWRAPSRKRPK